MRSSRLRLRSWLEMITSRKSVLSVFLSSICWRDSHLLNFPWIHTWLCFHPCVSASSKFKRIHIMLMYCLTYFTAPFPLLLWRIPPNSPSLTPFSNSLRCPARVLTSEWPRTSWPLLPLARDCTLPSANPKPSTSQPMPKTLL